MSVLCSQFIYSQDEAPVVLLGRRRSENDVGRAAEQIGQELDHCCFESSSGNGENGLPQFHLVGAKIGSQSILAAHGFREQL